MREKTIPSRAAGPPPRRINCSQSFGHGKSADPQGKATELAALEAALSDVRAERAEIEKQQAAVHVELDKINPNWRDDRPGVRPLGKCRCQQCGRPVIPISAGLAGIRIAAHIQEQLTTLCSQCANQLIDQESAERQAGDPQKQTSLAELPSTTEPAKPEQRFRQGLRYDLAIAAAEFQKKQDVNQHTYHWGDAVLRAEDDRRYFENCREAYISDVLNACRRWFPRLVSVFQRRTLIQAAVDEAADTVHLLVAIHGNFHEVLRGIPVFTILRDVALPPSIGAVEGLCEQTRQTIHLGLEQMVSEQLAQCLGFCLPGEDQRPKPVREGQIAEWLLHELRMIRRLYRDNGWPATTIRNKYPLVVWEWIDRLPADRRKPFLDIADWDDGIPFLQRQIATLYAFSGRKGKRPSGRTVAEWIKAWRAWDREEKR